jgi:hypothetical protein
VALAAGCTQQPAPTADAPQATAPTGAAAADEPESTLPAGLRLFREDELTQARRLSNQSCQIAKINGQSFGVDPVEANRKEPIRLTGWFLSDISKRTGIPASIRIVDVAGTTGWESSIDRWVSRLDVNATKGGVDSGDAGFVDAVKLRQLPVGQYKVFLVFEEGGKKYRCDHSRVIVLK